VIIEGARSNFATASSLWRTPPLVFWLSTFATANLRLDPQLSTFLRHRNAKPFFFLFLDDDPWCDHHHEAVRLTSDRDVAE
jgi:hypothetical protein